MIFLTEVPLIQSSLGVIALKILLNALALFVAASLLKGVRINNFGKALLAALVLAVLNATIGAIMYWLSLPLQIMTLGLFTLVVNAVIIWMAAYVVAGFDVKNFLTAFWMALLTAIFNTVLYALFL